MAGARAGSAPPGPRGEGAPGSRRSRSAGGAGSRSPRLRPLFLWVRQRDTAVLQVHCEDYDPRNRLRLARTPLGWRALPRTETFDAIRLPAARPPPAPRPRAAARRAGAPRRSRARRRRRPAPSRPSAADPPPPSPGGGSPESASRVSFERSKRDSPAWNLPDLEISIPSHTIHVPPRSERRERSLSPEPSLSERDFNPTPLDKLLAVAELEFNQQQTVSPDLEEPSVSNPLHRQFAKFPFLSEDECDRDIAAFDIQDHDIRDIPGHDIPDAVANATHEDAFFANKPSRSERKMIEDDNVFQGGMVAAKDLFESITESHYMPVDLDHHDHEAINANELLDSLVEKGCEDHNIIGNDFDKIEHIVNDNQDHIEGDYEEDDEEMLMDDAPVSDIIHRLEQSLDSPGQNSMTAAQGLLHLQQMTEELAEAHLRGPVDEGVDYSEETYDKEREPHMESSPNNAETNEPIEDKEKDICAKIGEDDEEGTGDISQSNNLPMQDENHSEIDNENNDNVESEDYSSGEQASESDFPHTSCVTSLTKVREDDQLSNKEMSTLDKESEIHDSGDDMMPTDLRMNASSKGDSNIVDDVTDELSNKSDEMPKDLSCRKRPASPLCPSPQRFESPRPASRGSDTVQSPQPSGIPAVPPSPELFPPPQSRSNSKSLFLETLLASPSPKMCFSSELTITKHQNEPLNLGKSRKSASPTVSSCSEEVKKSKTFGEPEEKRYRKDVPDEAPLQKLNKLFSKSSDCVLESKPKKADSKAHRSTAEPTPLEQLQLLRCSSEFDVPDPLLVPKERFSAILASPAREIPALLLQRPELRLPEAFAFPAVLQDPDILVVSLSQLEGILQKHRTVTEKSQETHKQKELKQPKPTTPNGLPETAKAHSTAAPLVAESPLRSLAGMGTGAGAGAETMAGDIDAATSAALNQMLWLPYLSQFEAAMACSQNVDFLKALNSPVPPGYPAAQAPYPDISQMFSQQSRFMNSSGYPGIPPLDYGNQLELAMWQEAMAQANGPNFQRTLKTNADTNFLKNTEAQNIFAQAAKIQQHHHQQQQSRGHSARTSPIARGWRAGVGAAPPPAGLPPFPWAGYPARPPQHPAQYSPTARGRHHQPPPSPSAYYHNNNYLGGGSKQPGGRGQPAPHAPPAEQRPRITVKSLQNLLEPPEVGSSTHPPEELQHDPHTPLWHPLFGNQKNYSSPWNWTTVTVNGD